MIRPPVLSPSIVLIACGGLFISSSLSDSNNVTNGNVNVASPAPPSSATSHEVWISVDRNDGKGEGTEVDPFDGSTQSKFDALLSGSNPNARIFNEDDLIIHLGPTHGKSFDTQIDATTGLAHPWSVRRGWKIIGAGKDLTTVRMVPKAGGTFGALNVFQGSGGENTLSDLTLDCNWEGLRTYARPSTIGGRTITVNATNGSTAIVLKDGTPGKDYFFGRYDIGKQITATGFTRGTAIANVIDATHAILTNNFSGTTGSVSVTIGKGWDVNSSGASLAGSNNVIERVRVKNCYGNFEASTPKVNYETFGLIIAATALADGVNNVIRNCDSIEPAGDYGSPFGAFGINSHWLKDSRVENNYAQGYNNGHNSGFTTGGVNGARTDGLVVQNNTFVDCGAGAFYSDTDQTRHLQVLNNRVVRAQAGCSLSAKSSGAWTKDDVEIAGNNIWFQSRSNSAYGIYVNGDTTTRLNIHDNIFKYTEDGLAGRINNWSMFIVAKSVKITNNTVPDQTGLKSTVLMADTRRSSEVTRSRNLTSTGATVRGLEDTEPTAPFR